MKLNRLNTDHVQPQNPLFTSGSQHPPRSRHAVHLGGLVSFIFRCLIKDYEHRPLSSELLNHPFIKQVPSDVSKVYICTDKQRLYV